MLPHMNELTNENQFQPDATLAAMVEHMIKVQGRKNVEATLASGVVLRGKAMPRRVLADVVQRLPAPKVPDFTYKIDGKDVTEPNPDDPEYKEAVRVNHGDRLHATNRAMYSMGTELVSVPEGMYRPEQDEWIEELTALGVIGEDDVPKLPLMRYLMWLERYVMSDEDAATVWAIALAATGTIEVEVAAAVAYFRREEEQRTAVLSSVIERLATDDGLVGAGENPPDVGPGD